MARESMIYGDEEMYEIVTKDEKARQKHAKMQAQVIVVLSTVMIGVLAFSAATGSTGGSGFGPKTVSLTGELSKSSPLFAQFSEYFKAVVPSSTPVRVHEDFRAGLSGWIGGRDGDWNSTSGLVRPGRMRIWKPSLKLSDYRMEFEGQIEKSAMSWAFRAPDLKNYYASKIVVRTRGSLSTADIVRYTVLNGMERERTRLPLPISVRPDTLYHVQMSVRGDSFVTRVNGQIVDTWSDARLKRGGVGFFSERGEQSSIHWVDVREEREGLLGRLFAMGFFVPPVELYY